MNDDRLWSRITHRRIRTATFPTVWRGYDPRAVHGFLDRIADELLRLQLRLADADRTRRGRIPRQRIDRDPASSDRLHQAESRWPINGRRSDRGAPPNAA
ncbi:MAG TPA: DivIVA domain-containing protein [Micromonosporaceae bacterium]